MGVEKKLVLMQLRQVDLGFVQCLGQNVVRYDQLFFLLFPRAQVQSLNGAVSTVHRRIPAIQHRQLEWIRIFVEWAMERDIQKRIGGDEGVRLDGVEIGVVAYESSQCRALPQRSQLFQTEPRVFRFEPVPIA